MIKSYGKKPKASVRSAEERNVLVEANLDVAETVIRRLWHKSPIIRRVGWDEAMQVAALVLIRAAEIWIDRGDKPFKAYAYTACIRSLRQLIVNSQLKVRRWGNHEDEMVLSGFEESWFSKSLRDYRENHEARASRLDAVRQRVAHLLSMMPDGVERIWLERRLNGMSRLEAWESMGGTRRTLESVEGKALRMARGLAKEQGETCC